MAQEIDLTSEENRKLIAQRLRNMANDVEHGRRTVDSFAIEPEWKGTRMTGRVFLKLAFWVKAIEK